MKRKLKQAGASAHLVIGEAGNQKKTDSSIEPIFGYDNSGPFEI